MTDWGSHAQLYQSSSLSNECILESSRQTLERRVPVTPTSFFPSTKFLDICPGEIDKSTYPRGSRCQASIYRAFIRSRFVRSTMREQCTWDVPKVKVSQNLKTKASTTTRYQTITVYYRLIEGILILQPCDSLRHNPKRASISLYSSRAT